MRQATLPWVAPLPSLHSTQPSVDCAHHSARPGSPPSSPRHVTLHPSICSGGPDTPPFRCSAPFLQEAPPHQLGPHLEHQLDPALFSSSQDGTSPDQPIHRSTLSSIPQQPAMDAADMHSASSSAYSSAAGSSAVLVSTQQSDVSSIADTQTSVATPQPLSQESDLLSVYIAPATPTVQAAQLSHPPLHPFFRSGGSSVHPQRSQDESDAERKQPARSSRTRAPVSYREDLKAVLRADAAQESARLKDEKRQAQLAKRAQRSVQDKQAKLNGKHEPHNADGFELVGARVAKPLTVQNTAASAPAPESDPRSASKTQPQSVAKVVEPKPLSLAVKGTHAAATANPHPFFTKKHKHPPPPAEPRSLSRPKNGGESETVTPSASDGKAKVSAKSSSNSNTAPASWSLFAAPRAPSSKPKKPLHALWPSHDDTHVLGLRDDEDALLLRAHSDLQAFRTRWSSRSTLSSGPHMEGEGPSSDFIAQMNRARPDPALSAISLADSVETLESINDFIAQYVDASRLPSSSFTHLVQQGEACRKNGQLWIDAYRPHTAAECLGNEANAAYLLEWLRRLLVAAPGVVRTSDTKRKNGVQRRVDRKRKKRATRGYSDDDEDSDNMADFIVDDDEEEDAIDEYDETVTDEEWFSRFAKIDRRSTLSEDESVDLADSQVTATEGATSSQELNRPTQQQPQNHFASLDRLTNCIVLSGPSGAGKTASVYACASELGYEVFELYPGMGKRSGKELLSAVGDLGRNHMVSSGGVGGGATFKPKLAPTTSATATATSVSTSATVRQSLILIEEADILFEEDKGFWPAVVELVAVSKRPVVVVCNELELVPIHELPVQQVLQFERPRLDKVVPWLQTVAAGSGRYLASDTVKEMLLKLEATEQPLHVAGEGDKDDLVVDLRQAMQQLQFGHVATCDDAQEDVLKTLAAVSVDMKQVARAAESSSLADIFECGMARQGNIEASGDFGVDHHSSSRQLGSWTQLVPQPLGSQQQRDALVGSMQVDYRSAFTDLHAPQTGTACSSGLNTKRVSMNASASMDLQMNRMQTRQAFLLRKLLRPFFRHRPSSTLAAPYHMTEYAPFVRLMALVDQDLAHIHAALHQQSVLESASSCTPTTGRTTRNSWRLTSWLTGETPGYERWLIEIGPEEVKVARETSIVFH